MITYSSSAPFPYYSLRWPIEIGQSIDFANAASILTRSSVSGGPSSLLLQTSFRTLEVVQTCIDSDDNLHHGRETIQSAAMVTLTCGSSRGGAYVHPPTVQPYGADA